MENTKEKTFTPFPSKHFSTKIKITDCLLCRAMGFRPSESELAELIEEIDEDGSGAIEFGEFAQLCAKFLVEVPDQH